MPKARTAKHMIVNGRVQRVGFRQKVISAAKGYNIAGWISNRKHGAVQLHLEGDPSEIDALISRILAEEFGGVTFASIFSVEAIGYSEFDLCTTEQAAEAIANDCFAEQLSTGLHLAQKSFAASAVGLANDAARSPKALAPSVSKGSNRVFQAIPPNYITKAFFRKRGMSHARMFSCSFAAEMLSHSAIRSIARNSGKSKSPEDILNSKLIGSRFAEHLGCRVPITYQSNVPMKDVEFKPRTVVKPVNSASSHGAFVILSENEIYDLGRARTLSSFQETRLAMQGYLESKSFQRVNNDAWLVEEFIDDGHGRRPNDIKMLTFYGKVGLIQEEMKMPTRYCYYDRTGKRVATGRYEDKAFDGSGFSEADVMLAEQVSLKIPVPFMRIDFLKSGDGLVFGEFTPRPGNCYEFNPSTDRWLGRCFVEARAALDYDLRSGKIFDEYTTFFRS